jgi:hypothetical protein
VEKVQNLDLRGRNGVPQGLNPTHFIGFIGTTEVVP